MKNLLHSLLVIVLGARGCHIATHALTILLKVSHAFKKRKSAQGNDMHMVCLPALRRSIFPKAGRDGTCPPFLLL